MSDLRKQVATLAGVAPATVSRSFNQPESVSEQTRQRVIEAADKLNYRPNRHASILRRNDNGTILIADGLDIHSPSGAWRTYSWMWASIDQALRTAFADLPFGIERVSIGSTSELKHIIQSQPWAGMATLNIDSADWRSTIRASKLPYVHLATHSVPNFLNTYMPDEHYGSGLLAQQLKAAGVQRPAMISMPLEQLSQRKIRHDGFHEILPIAKVIEVKRGSKFRSHTEDILQAAIEKDKADAFYAQSSPLAAKVLFALEKLGLKVGEDISLVTYDHAHWLNHLPITITSLANPINTIIEEGIASLTQKIRCSSANKDSKATKLLPTLIAGNSIIKTTS